MVVTSFRYKYHISEDVTYIRVVPIYCLAGIRSESVQYAEKCSIKGLRRLENFIIHARLILSRARLGASFLSTMLIHPIPPVLEPTSGVWGRLPGASRRTVTRQGPANFTLAVNYQTSACQVQCSPYGFFFMPNCG